MPRAKRKPRLPPATQVIPRFLACRACRRFIRPGEVDCPFCHRNVAEAFMAWSERREKLAAALATVEAILGGASPSKAPRVKKRARKRVR